MLIGLQKFKEIKDFDRAPKETSHCKCNTARSWALWQKTNLSIFLPQQGFRQI